MINRIQKKGELYRITVKNMYGEDISFDITVERQKEHNKVSFTKTFYVLKSYDIDYIKSIIEEFIQNKRDLHNNFK